MQVIKLTPQQPKIKGLIAGDRVLVLCDTSGGSFVVVIPSGSGSVNRELLIKNIGVNNLSLSFDYSSLLGLSSGNTNSKTVLPDECFNIANDTKTGLWYQTNNLISLYS